MPDIRPPEIVFTKLEAYGAEGPYLVPLRAAQGETPVVDLDWRNTGIRFEAALLDFAAPVRNRYAMSGRGLEQGLDPARGAARGHHSPPAARHLHRPGEGL